MCSCFLIAQALVGPPKSLVYFDQGIKAGFPSPADSFAEVSLDINDLVVKNPISTFFLRVRGDSMKMLGIFDGDIVVADRSIKPTHKRIVVASIDGQFTLKQLILTKSGPTLVAANPDYPAIVPKEGEELVIWAVVTYSIRTFKSL